MSQEFDPYYEWLGIPPEAQPADYYRLLGISQFETNVNVISNAADQRMYFIRMFQNGPHSNETQMILNVLAHARITLLNPQSKSEYDQQLQSMMLSREMPSIAPPVPETPPEADYARNSTLDVIDSYSPLSEEELAIFQDENDDDSDSVEKEWNDLEDQTPAVPPSSDHADSSNRLNLDINLSAVNISKKKSHKLSEENEDQENINSTSAILFASIIFCLLIILTYLIVSRNFTKQTDEFKDVFYNTSAPVFAFNNSYVMRFTTKSPNF